MDFGWEKEETARKTMPFGSVDEEIQSNESKRNPERWGCGGEFERIQGGKKFGQKENGWDGIKAGGHRP
jgi:hypothetical protein